jgi:hypothetical protein
MKKLLSIVCCAVILLSVSSCTKQYITPNPNQTVTYNLTSADWQAYSDGKSYFAALDAPLIDGGFAQYGGVVVSISYDGGTTYEQLPEVYNNLAFSYTYNKGNITIYAQTADGTTPIQPTDPIKVKVILVASN